jgi:hypothetical protein
MADAHQVLPPGQHGVVIQPDQVRRELVHHGRAGGRRGQDVAARDVELLCQQKGDRLTGRCGGLFRIGPEDPGDRTLPAGGGDDHVVAHRHATGGNGAREAAEVLVRPIHPLHREAQRLRRRIGGDVHRLEVLEQRRPGVPGHGRGPRRDVVAPLRGYGDRADGREAQPRGEGLPMGQHLFEGGLREFGGIHLVHREHHVPDAEKRADVGVPAGLGENALACIHQDDREVSVRRAGRHVARVLFVTRRVRDDEGSARRLEETMRDVDGDALLALRLQPVHEQREVDLVPCRAVPPAVAFQRGKSVVHDQPGVMEEPADEGRLPVIDGTAGQEAQQPAGGFGATFGPRH